jgi:phenylacetate-CoA ligase
MIKLKGTTLYPPAIFEILQQSDSITDYVVEVCISSLGTDELKLHIQARDGQSDEMKRQLEAAFQSRLRVVPQIMIATAKEIEILQHSGASRKLKKFLDSRK